MFTAIVLICLWADVPEAKDCTPERAAAAFAAPEAKLTLEACQAEALEVGRKLQGRIGEDLYIRTGCISEGSGA